MSKMTHPPLSSDKIGKMNPPLLFICIGVSGCGKSTLAAKLARHYGAKFMEADDFHSDENKQHMASGRPLTDAMRTPWINAMCEFLQGQKMAGHNCVLSYSGLRVAHRERFRGLGYTTVFIFLDGTKALISQRLRARKGHFMGSDLVESQFQALQRPDNEPDVLTVAINQPVSRILHDAKAQIDQLRLLP